MTTASITHPAGTPGRKWGIAGIFVGVLLAGYLLFVLTTTYDTQVKLQDSLVEQQRQGVAKHAITIEHFLDERRNDLRYLADAREISVYFENKALGMSMEYGLGSSLIDITTYFRYFVADRKTASEPIYTRIALLDAAGGMLADTAEGGAAITVDSTLADPAQVAIRVDTQRIGAEIELRMPIAYKGQASGQLVAFLSTPTFVEHFVRQPADRPGRQTFLSTEQGIISPTVAHMPPANMALSKMHRYDSYDSDGAPLERVALRIPIADSPLRLIATFTVDDVFGSSPPWRMPLTLALLTLFIGAGTFYAYRANTRNLLLKTRLDEARAANYAKTRFLENT